MPLGTVVKEEGCIIADLANKDSTFVVAAGGDGGMGNVCFTTPEHKSPREATDGALGEERVLEVELKSIADIGMVIRIIMLLVIVMIIIVIIGWVSKCWQVNIVEMCIKSQTQNRIVPVHDS